MLVIVGLLMARQATVDAAAEAGATPTSTTIAEQSDSDGALTDVSDGHAADGQSAAFDVGTDRGETTDEIVVAAIDVMRPR